MALVVVVAQLKGGAGKSSLVTNLAAHWHAEGRRVLVVDVDPQGTAQRWASVAAEAGHAAPPVVSMNAPELVRDLARIADGWDLVVVDTPPRIASAQRAAMVVADVVLLPCTPGGADLWALRDTIEVLNEARALRPELVAAAVLNRASRTTLAQATLAALRDAELAVLSSALGARVAFGEAMTSGLGVATYAAGSPAAQEVAAVAVETVALLERSNAWARAS